jgi:hypothetical protein
MDYWKQSIINILRAFQYTLGAVLVGKVPDAVAGYLVSAKQSA